MSPPSSKARADRQKESKSTWTLMESVEILPRAPPKYRTSIHNAAAKIQNAAVKRTASINRAPPRTPNRPVGDPRSQPDMIRGRSPSARRTLRASLSAIGFLSRKKRPGGWHGGASKDARYCGHRGPSRKPTAKSEGEAEAGQPAPGAERGGFEPPMPGLPT